LVRLFPSASKKALRSSLRDLEVAQIVIRTDKTVLAQGGPNGVTLSMRLPANVTTFRSRAGAGVDYYFLYGPNLNAVVSEYRTATGEAPLFPKWAYGFWQCRERYSS